VNPWNCGVAATSDNSGMSLPWYRYVATYESEADRSRHWIPGLDPLSFGPACRGSIQAVLFAGLAIGFHRPSTTSRRIVSERMLIVYSGPFRFQSAS
jgi:hypothetical protein